MFGRFFDHTSKNTDMFFVKFYENMKLAILCFSVKLKCCKNEKKVWYRNFRYLLLPTNVDSYTIFDHQTHNKVVPDFSLDTKKNIHHKYKTYPIFILKDRKFLV